VRFGDFLKATVMLCAGSATLLATLTIVSLARDSEPTLVTVSLGWWVAAVAIGVLLGRRNQASPAIGRLLAGARSQTTLPELRPGNTLLNRLWPLLVMTGAAGVAGVIQPQVSAIAAGFAIIWALAWRRQEAAVTAIEERDGAQFYVDRTSPLAPIQLVRTPGLRGARPTPRATVR
jgi:hypothetical protein